MQQPLQRWIVRLPQMALPAAAWTRTLLLQQMNLPMRTLLQLLRWMFLLSSSSNSSRLRSLLPRQTLLKVQETVKQLHSRRKQQQQQQQPQRLQQLHRRVLLLILMPMQLLQVRINRRQPARLPLLMLSKAPPLTQQLPLSQQLQ
jgi:hypothetical protein